MDECALNDKWSDTFHYCSYTTWKGWRIDVNIGYQVGSGIITEEMTCFVCVSEQSENETLIPLSFLCDVTVDQFMTIITK